MLAGYQWIQKIEIGLYRSPDDEFGLLERINLAFTGRSCANQPRPYDFLFRPLEDHCFCFEVQRSCLAWLIFVLVDYCHGFPDNEGLIDFTTDTRGISAVFDQALIRICSLGRSIQKCVGLPRPRIGEIGQARPEFGFPVRLQGNDRFLCGGVFFQVFEYLV